MRNKFINAKAPLALFALLVFLLAGTESARAGTTVILLNADGPNEGLNDPTPAAPVGGNTGTTLGQQRMIALQHAADKWGATLDSPEAIYIVVAFNPLPAGVLASAGTWDLFSDMVPSGLFPGAQFPATWYGSALSDKRAGRDMDVTSPDINSQFNSAPGTFYLGLDGNETAGSDVVSTALHEFGHGLGFQNFVTEQTGANFGGFTSGDRFYPVQTDIYSRYTLDTTTGKHWNEMTQTERQQSAVRFGRVVWDGPNVTAAAPSVLSFGSPELKVTSPAAVAGDYQFGTASAFGSPIGSPTVSAPIVVGLDASNAAGPSTTDGCTALTNSAAVAGNIALIDRGVCGFAVKAKNAQLAGAAAVIIANNVAGAPPGMGGVDPTVTIPAASITLADANAIKAQLANNVAVLATLGLDNTIRAGTDALGRVRLYMPNPVVSGSSGSHFDVIARRNLLMEPAINPDLTHNVSAPHDLTLELMRDIGWFPDADNDGKATADDCDDTSDFSATASIGSCGTDVTNYLFTDGCTLNDKIQAAAASSSNHGQFVSAISHLSNALRKAGLITNDQKSAMQTCAAGASIP